MVIMVNRYGATFLDPLILVSLITGVGVTVCRPAG
jgi:hypothetical protein